MVAVRSHAQSGLSLLIKEQRIVEVVHESFTPLICGTTGGMGRLV